MKKNLLLIIMCLVASATVFAQEAKTDVVEPVKNLDEMAVIEIQNATYDFGDIPQGTPVTAEFPFKNTGKSPLIISQVKTSCGCTVSSYPKEPIAPGKDGIIKLTYNAARENTFSKSATVMSNATEPSKLLYLKGKVLPKAVDPNATPAQTGNK